MAAGSANGDEPTRGFPAAERFGRFAQSFSGFVDREEFRQGGHGQGLGITQFTNFQFSMND